MDIKELKNTDKLSVEWLVTIPSSKINIELDKKYFELMNKLNLPGFRPGKVPKTIIKKRFGQNVVSEVLDKIRELKSIQKDKNIDFDIEIDGGINFENSKTAIKAGANILVSGTTIFKSNNGDIKKNIDLLKSL